MPPISPIVKPLGPVVKWVYRLAPGVAAAIDELLDQVEDGAEPSWMKVQAVFTRGTPVGTIEDKAICTWDIANLTDGNFDSSWSAADFTAVKARVNGMISDWAAMMSNQFTCTERRYYLTRFAEIQTPEHRFEYGGAPISLDVVPIVGASASEALPYQVALSVTERTAWPRHWGRFYLPGATETLSDGKGRWTAATVNSLLASFTSHYNWFWDNQFPIIVPVTQRMNPGDPPGTVRLVKEILSVNELQIDDIPDVQRRRRPKQPAIRARTALS